MPSPPQKPADIAAEFHRLDMLTERLRYLKRAAELQPRGDAYRRAAAWPRQRRPPIVCIGASIPTRRER